MIPNPNSVTWPISRLDSLLSELINESEESLSYQPLTDPYIPNSTDWTQKSCHFGNPASISSYQPKLDQHHTLTFWHVILFLKLNLSLKVILNLKLGIPFRFLIQ